MICQPSTPVGLLLKAAPPAAVAAVAAPVRPPAHGLVPPPSVSSLRCLPPSSLAPAGPPPSCVCVGLLRRCCVPEPEGEHASRRLRAFPSQWVVQCGCDASQTQTFQRTNELI